MAIGRTQVISFREYVPPTSGKVYYTAKIQGYGILEEIEVRFYSGAETVLTLRPTLERKGTKFLENLITYSNLPYLVGDDDMHSFKVNRSVAYGDMVILEVENKSEEYNYNIAVDIKLTYVE